MVWLVIIVGAVVSLAGVAWFHAEIAQALMDAGMRLPSMLYMQRGRALYLPFLEQDAIMRRWDGELRITLASGERVRIRQQNHGDTRTPSWFDVALEFRFPVVPLNVSVMRESGLVFSTEPKPEGNMLGAFNWQERCKHPESPGQIHIFGWREDARKKRTLPIHLALALWLEHRNLDTLDLLMQTPLSGADQEHATFMLTGVERGSSSLTLTYHGRFGAEVSPEDEQRMTQAVAHHARYLARGLGAGDLMQRCLEHLEFLHDSPPGIKSLSAQVYADQLGLLDDSERAQAAQHFSQLVRQDPSRFEAADLVSWFGESVFDEISDEQLLAYGVHESSDVLCAMLHARLAPIQLLNDQRLCWPLREKVLRRVLSEDEGLALHGPPLMSNVTKENLPLCVGFLAREASSVLWRAPWLIKSLEKSFAAFESADWSALYACVFGSEEREGEAFTSTRIARDVIGEVTYRLLASRAEELAGAPLMHYQALCWSYRRDREVDSAPWRSFVQALDEAKIEHVLKHSWMWEGEPFLFIYTLCTQPTFSRFVDLYPARFEQMLTTFDIAFRRQSDPLELEMFGTIVCTMLAQEAPVMRSHRLEEIYGSMSKAYITQAEKQGITAETVRMLHTLTQQAPPRQAAMMNYTLGHWVNGMDRGALAGAVTHVESHGELAGGLTVK